MKNTFFKKSVVLLLAIAMVFSLAGCKKKENVQEKQMMTEEEKNSVYKYETLDCKDSEDMGNIQFVGEKMYAIIYDYDDQTYETTEWFVTYDLEGNELARFEVPWGWDDTSSWGINQLVVTPKNEVYGVQYKYTSYLDSDSGNWLYEESYELLKMDEQGNQIWSIPLGGTDYDDNGEGEWYGVERLLCDNEGNIWVFDSLKYTCYDGEGNPSVAIDALENSSGDVWATKDGNFIVGQWDSDWTSINFYELDVASGKISEEALQMPCSYYQYSYYSGIDSEYDMYAINSIGVWAFNWGDTELTKVMDYILSDFEGTMIYNLRAISDEQFIGVYYDSEGQNQVATFTKVPATEVVDKYIIKLACYYLDSDVRKQVIEFNRSHEDVRIVLDDYSAYNTEENWETGIEALNNDILSGNIPDILVVPSNLDLGNYANKGLFTDMYKLMDADESISRDDYLQNILALGEYNGELYELIPCFEAITFAGKTSDVGDGFNWTYDDVNALLAKKGDGVRLFPADVTRSTVMYYGINLAFDQFYNNNTGECNFNSPEFVQFLELLNQYPEETPEDLWDSEDYWISYDNQWRNGETLLRYEWIYSFSSYIEDTQGYFGEPVSYIGFPTAEGSGSAANVDYTFAISEESAFKTEAWEYVSSFIKDEYQESITSGFPVKLSALEKKAEQERQPRTWVDEETGEEFVEENYFWIGEEELILELPTEEECQYVMDFLKSIDYRQQDVSDITAIIEEDAAAYFNGQKTAQQVAETIQSRVKILVSEKR